MPRVRALLSAWWEANARDLPWRFGRATPWGVLVSEVMSQQTQMSRVVPYWTDWMRVWPDVTALAGASTAEVITAWGRLGYPRRALRLQECARVVFEQYHGRLPQTYDELTALPGIGDYTASAVLSFAFGVRIAVVDTNIRRVLSRVFLGVESRGGAASPAERALAGRVLPQDDETDVRDAIEAANARETVNAPESAIREMTQRSTRPSVIWNQSVMELGALVCTAKNPLCDQCPIGEHCAFLAAGRPGLGERRTRPRQRFQGTDRQVRGIILDALRAEPILARERLEFLWPDHVQLDRCIASLDDDGLVDMLPDGSLRLNFKLAADRGVNPRKPPLSASFESVPEVDWMACPPSAHPSPDPDGKAAQRVVSPQRRAMHRRRRRGRAGHCAGRGLAGGVLRVQSRPRRGGWHEPAASHTDRA